MNRFAAAVAGGAAGTAAMSVLLLLLEVQTRAVIGIFAAVARFAGTPGNLALGFALFAAAGVVAWPVLFVALEHRLPRGPDSAARGTVFATGLWVLFVLLGRGDIWGPVFVIYAAYTLFAHWAYGFTLGLVYATLTASDSETAGAAEAAS